jgi:hypothetical protein
VFAILISHFGLESTQNKAAATEHSEKKSIIFAMKGAIF